MSTGQTYGEHLPDQVERLAALSDAQIELLGDIRELYRERSVLEREYAAKLQALARKAAEKKAKKMASLVLGDEPTKGWDESTLRNSTVDAVYSQVIGLVAESAQDHVKLADAVGAQIVEILRAVEKKHEDAKKKQMAFFTKLVSERDRVYTERAKFKQKYDDECAEVESFRAKQGRAHDDKHAERAAKQFEQQEADMNNAKNAYLVSIAVANSTKAKFFDVDLPALENQFQRLQSALINSMTGIILQAVSLEDAHLDTLKKRVASVNASAEAVNPTADQDLFIDYNIRPFSAPADWSFEPCGVHYDTEAMITEPSAKVVLQNKLTKSRSKLQELRSVLRDKQSEATKLERHFEKQTSSRAQGTGDDVIDLYLSAHHDYTFYSNSECILQSEIDTIKEALGGDEGGQNPHQFKSASFSIPTTCGYCKTSIWGLSNKGKTCRVCNLSVHAKCELKVPADCGGEKGKHGDMGISTSSSKSTLTHRASTLSNKSSVTTSSVNSTPTPSSFIDSPSTISYSEIPKARVLYEYAATSPYELSVPDGTIVKILEEDDGSGWVKVDDGVGGKGLVPAAYIEMIVEQAPTKRVPPTPPPPRGAKGSGKFVRGIYDYAAQGPDEMDVQTGQMIELSSGAGGGTSYAEGWWEGVSASGKKGIFPSNYVELV